VVVAPDFRPFTADDDGTRLILRRHLTVPALLLRACLYLLLLAVLALFAALPYAAWTRTADDLALTVVGLVVLLPLNWLVLRLVLLGFRLDGVRRIECRPDRLDLFTRGAFRRRHVHIRNVVALVARTVRESTEHGDVRWLELRTRTDAGAIDLGHLALHPDADPAREAAARAAAAHIAARLHVPLELHDEHGHPVT
jgi:hypothetical protein